MNFYNKYILPKLINSAMNKRDKIQDRQDTVCGVSGVVCEIGFGSGLNLPHYKNVSTLYALEPSLELYNLAQERINQASFQIKHLQASAEEIPLDTNSVDCVVSTWSLCSIPHPEMALKEVFRILKPGGKFVFVEHGKSARHFVAKVQKFFTPIQKRIAGGCHLDREIERLIIDAGFEIEKIEKPQARLQPLSFMYKGSAIAKK
jgi:ubiquinone/menaquinone biosynthesis C-methylase UbiE